MRYDFIDEYPESCASTPLEREVRWLENQLKHRDHFLDQHIDQLRGQIARLRDRVWVLIAVLIFVAILK